MTVIYVSNSGTHVPGERYIGTTHTAIQGAIDHAASKGGGDIFIEAGTYICASPVTISTSNIRLKGEGFHTKLTPTFTNNETFAVIKVVGGVGSHVNNTVIEDLLIGGIPNTRVGSNGIYLLYADNSKVTGNLIQYNNLYAILLEESSGNVISSNTMQYHDGAGVSLTWASNNNIITDNIIQNNGGSGIYSYSSYSNKMSCNMIQNCGSEGIYLYNSSDNIMSNNVIRNNVKYGMYLYTAASNTIIGNVLRNNQGGIYLYYSSDKNIISGNNTRINSEKDIYINSTSANNMITGNEARSVSFDGTGNTQY